MKLRVNAIHVIIVLCAVGVLTSCSKSSSNSSGTGGSGTNPGSTIFPLAVNNSWSYKLKNYNTTTGALTDSSLFTLTITGKISANGTTYYQFQNSADTTTLETLAGITATTLGSIDSSYGLNYYTFFATGSGDSTLSVSSWPIPVTINGAQCEGTNKLYAYYADTTLINEDGTTYSQSMKNVILTYDCSGNKLYANVYYIKQGVGLVRFSKYIYNANGEHLLKLAWVLESENLN